MCRRQPRVVGCSPNTVKAALASFGPPRYVRAATGSLVDAFEPRIRELWSRPDRLPATYRRTHGIRYFHGCYSLGDDQLWAVIRSRKGGDHSLTALKSVRAARPDGAPIYVIMDNLSANKTPTIRAWAKKNKVELCLTPTYASWANPIEAQLGPLRTFVMGDSNHPNHAVLARRLQAYLRWRNANSRHPDVLAAQRRERARIRSQRQQRWGRPRAKAA
jgi:DDE superfamily endonuclease